MRVEKWLRVRRSNNGRVSDDSLLFKENNRTFFTICIPPQRTLSPSPGIPTCHSPTPVGGSIDVASNPDILQLDSLTQQQTTPFDFDDRQAFTPEFEYHSLFGRYPPQQPDSRRSIKILESHKVNTSGSSLLAKKRINRSQYVPTLCRSVTPEPQLVPDSETTASFRNAEVLLTSAYDREFSVDDCPY